MIRKPIATKGAPAAIGPYSQALRAGNMLFCSGQIPLDPETGAMVKGDIGEQTRRVLLNLKAVLEAGGASLASVAKTTVLLRDMGDFAGMNAVYAEFFPENPPARAAFQAARLPMDADVEIEAIAIIEE